MSNKPRVESYKQVNVVQGAGGLKKCIGGIRCKRKTKYSLFIDDGRTVLSRLWAVCCTHHLSKAVDMAWEENRKAK